MYVTRDSWETVKSAHVAPKPRVLFKTQRSAQDWNFNILDST